LHEILNASSTSIDRKNPNLYGTRGRGLIRGPVYWPVNRSPLKKLPLQEKPAHAIPRRNLNLLNQSNFDVPDSIVESQPFNDALSKEEWPRRLTF
jgi:hypothetical protein